MQSKLKLVFLAGLISAVCAPAVFAADDGVLVQAAKDSWRHDIAQIATPAAGCFHASYPSIVWEQVACNQLAPRAHTVPRRTVFGQEQTVGNGDDYTMNTSSLLTKAVGSFPTYSGVTSEKSVGVAAYGDGGILGSSEYSLQMNTGFDNTTAACDGGDSGCVVWQQFIYATDYSETGEGTAFIQNWLIGWGNSSCPSGFGSDGEGDCYGNSSGTQLADISPLNLGSVTLTGTATSGGNDTVVVTYDGTAYSNSQKDSTLDIASVWKQVEYNIVGDAGGSEAEFNKSDVLIKVKIAGTTVSDSTVTCTSDNGTTGESNNLTLGSCTVSGNGTTSPSITFTETD